MKKIILMFILAFPFTSFCQDFKKADLIGEWKITKMEFYMDGNLVRKVYLKDKAGALDTIVEGPQMGEMDEKFTTFAKLLVGTIMSFKDNDFFTWNVSDPTFKIIDKYWTIVPNTNDIIINEWEAKSSVKGGLMGFKIIMIDKGLMTLDTDDSGAELKFELIKE